MAAGLQITLDELERDALTEIVNIGVSRAAVSLRKMVGVEVLLSVPSLDIISEEVAATVITERESEDLVAVRQDFSGAFAGRAMLIFPQANSLDLVKAVAGDDMSREALTELETEALAETGNVILNGCLASMANMLQRSLTMSIPEVLRGTGHQLFASGRAPASGDDAVVLFLYIDFMVRQRDIRGYIAMLMDLPSIPTLRDLICDFIARVIAEGGAAFA